MLNLEQPLQLSAVSLAVFRWMRPGLATLTAARFPPFSSRAEQGRYIFRPLLVLLPTGGDLGSDEDLPPIREIIYVGRRVGCGVLRFGRHDQKSASFQKSGEFQKSAIPEVRRTIGS